MRLWSICLVYLLITCLGITACTRVDKTDNISRSADKVALHAIHTEKLRDIMHKISNLMENRDVTLTLVDELREDYMQSLIDAAGDLVYAAETLSLQGPIDNLTERDETEFRNLAGRFYENAVNLHLRAMDSNFMEMDSAYKNLDETCNSCHRLFRPD